MGTNRTNSDLNNVSILAKNALWANLGNYVGLIFIPITSLLTTRTLGAEDFGVFSLIQNWYSFLVGLGSLGIIGANLRLIPLYSGQNEYDKIKGIIYFTFQITGMVSCILFLLIFLFPEVFCEYILMKSDSISDMKYESIVIPAFKYFAISIVFTILYQAALSSLNGLKAIKYKVIANDLIAPSVKTFFLVVFLSMGFGVYGALSANLIQDGVILVISAYFLFKQFPFVLSKAIKKVVEVKKILTFSMALYANSLLNKYSFQLDTLFLGYFGEIKSVGIYAIATNLTRIVGLPSYAIMSIFGPLSGELYSRGDKKELSKIYKTATKWTLSISFPLFSSYLLFPHDILNIFGPEFVEGTTAFIIICVGSLIADFLGISGTLIVSTGRASLNLINSIILAMLNVSLFFILIPSYGIIGAAIASTSSLLTINFIRLVQVYVIMHIHPFQLSLFKPICASLLAAVVVRFAQWIATAIFDIHAQYVFIIYAFIFGLFYIFALRIIGFDEEDKVVLNILSRKFFIAKWIFKKTNTI